MIDGTAASRSIVAAAGRPATRGAYWVMNRATPTPTGTAMSMAIAEESTVAQSRSGMPKRGSAPRASHSREVRKLALLFSRAGPPGTPGRRRPGDEGDDQEARRPGSAAEEPVAEPAGRRAVAASAGVRPVGAGELVDGGAAGHRWGHVGRPAWCRAAGRSRPAPRAVGQGVSPVASGQDERLDRRRDLGAGPRSGSGA